MPTCDVQRTSLHAFPQRSSSVLDRQMSLGAPCRETATHSTKTLGASAGPARAGAPIKEFLLCENHSQLVVQIDQELMDDGWSTAFAERPRSLI